MNTLRRKIKGFTLVELLVVIAIIALLVAIVFPAISNALLRGRVTATSVNARNIHQAIISKSVSDIYFATASPFPSGSRFQTSTDYFEYLVTGNVLNVAWSFFAPPGVPAARDREEFMSPAGQRNGWCVVNDSENLPETAPMIFTRNLGGQDAAPPATSYDQLNELQTLENMLAGHPFLDRGFAFATRGGAAFALVGDDLIDVQRFNGLFVALRATTPATDLGNAILRPGPGY